MPIFSVIDIDEKLLDSAYALVRTVMPDVTAGQWRDYASDAKSRGGLLGLAGPDDNMFGFLAWRVEHGLRRGKTLHIDQFLTFELSRSAPGRRTLYEAAEALALDRKCKAIELRIEKCGAPAAASTAQYWFDLGCSLDSMIFGKPVSARRIESASCGAREGELRRNP